MIDLRRLALVESTGITALVAAETYARRAGWTLAIVKGPRGSTAPGTVARPAAARPVSALDYQI